MDEIDRQKKKQKLILLDTLRYSWILFFGYLANFWDPSIQVSMTTSLYITYKTLIWDLEMSGGIGGRRYWKGRYAAVIWKKAVTPNFDFLRYLYGQTQFFQAVLMH